MMRTTSIVVGIGAVLGLGALAGCPSPSGNPKTLWLAPDQGETKVKLIDHEPPPF